MDENIIPESLLIELRRMGYSEEMIRELFKWYDSSENKGVDGF